MNDSRSIEGALVRTVVNLLTNGLTFLVGCFVVLFIRWQLGLFLLATLIPFAYIRYYANARMRVLSLEMQERQASASAVLAESLAAVRTTKAFRQESYQQQIINRSLEKLREIYIRTNWFGVISTIGTSLITSLAMAFVLWYGLSKVVTKSMTIGEVVGVLYFLNFLYTPINTFVAANLSLQQAAAALHRIYEFLVEKPEDREGKRLPIKGSITFQQVSFAYEKGHPVLRDVSFSVKAGETIALVGRSGAGKSTLVNLILRFYEPSAGRILLDGKEASELSLDCLRDAIGLVEQQTFLFSGTIRENVRFGKLNATEEEIIEACRRSHALEFIQGLPDKFDTRVGERGMRLSSGQCQRLALARMFLKDPPVLILDEAVSALDSESESFIQRVLETLIADRTTIIIAHRLASLMLADRVVLLEDGKVAEDGTHQDLLEAGGVYTRLFQQQFQPQHTPSYIVGDGENSVQQERSI